MRQKKVHYEDVVLFWALNALFTKNKKLKEYNVPGLGAKNRKNTLYLKIRNHAERPEVDFPFILNDGGLSAAK